MQLIVANTDEIKAGLIDRTLDLGLTEGMPPVDEELSVRVFSKDELIVIAPPDHPFASLAPGKRRPGDVTSLFWTG